MSKEQIECEDCLNKFTIEYKTKDPILHCVFCGADIYSGEEEDELDMDYDEGYGC